MNLKELMSSNSAIFFDKEGFAREVQYNGEPILAIPEIGEGKNRDQLDNRKQTAFYRIQIADVATPGIGDVLIDGDVEWSFAEIAEKNSISHKIKVYADESAVILR